MISMDNSKTILPLRKLKYIILYHLRIVITHAAGWLGPSVFIFTTIFVLFA